MTDTMLHVATKPVRSAIAVFALALLLAGPSTLASEAGPGRGSRDDVYEARDRRVGYLERFYGHFEGERARPIAEMLPDDISWHMIGWREDVVPFAGLYSGHEEILRFFNDYFAAIKIREYHFQYRLVDGDYVSWHFRLVAEVPSTGKSFNAEFVHVWQFDGRGKPVFCRSYYDTQLQVAAFTVGGPTQLTDRQNRDDHFRVGCTPYDVQGMVKALYDLFYSGDIAGVFGMLADDVYVYFKGTDNPQSGEYHGSAGILQFIYNLAGTAALNDVTRFYITEGDRTDVVLLEHWTVFATGKSYHVHTVNSWRVNGQGKLMGFINYPDVDEVAAAYIP